MASDLKQNAVDQKQDDKVWFYIFDEKTLKIEAFINSNKTYIEKPQDEQKDNDNDKDQENENEKDQDNDNKDKDNDNDNKDNENKDKDKKQKNEIQQFSQNPECLSDFKRNKINDFKTQKSELEKNKLRVGISYYYETMIAHLLENLDFYFRNEINLLKIKVLFKKDESDKLKKYRDKCESIQAGLFLKRQKYYSEVLKEDTFLNKCQDYIAIEKLYCHEFWNFQSEKQRYFRYFCTCVRLFFFFYELAAFKNLQATYQSEINGGVQLSDERQQDDLDNLFQYSYDEAKYCLQLISQNYEINNQKSLGINLLILLLSNLLKKEGKKFEDTRILIDNKLTDHIISLKKEFKLVIEQSQSKADDIKNNQFKELELVKIVQEEVPLENNPELKQKIPYIKLNEEIEEEEKKKLEKQLQENEQEQETKVIEQNKNKGPNILISKS